MRLLPANPIALVDLVPILINADKNIIFPDTCALLDIVRSPIEHNTNIAKAGSEMATQINTSSPAFRVVVSSLFHREWTDNYETVEKQLLKGLADHQSLSKIVKQINTSVLGTSPIMPDVTLMEIESFLGQFCTTIIDYGDVLKADSAVTSLGADRVITGKAPSRKHGKKDSTKDCIIFEEVLALGSALAVAGFSKSVIFVSPNSAEYKDSGSLRPEIQADIVTANVVFAHNIAEAFHRACH